MSRRRACLVVPAAPAAKLAKGATLAADEVVLDLEDAVLPGVKDEARAAVAAALDGDWAAESVAVRVNAIGSPWCHSDLAALAASGRERPDRGAAEGRARRRPRVRRPAARGRRGRGGPDDADPPAGADRDRGGARGGRRDRPRVGAAGRAGAGLRRSRRLARPARRRGAEDWRYAQESVLVAARAAGIQAIDGPHLATRDDDAFRAGVMHARTLGFDGKWAIHPAQLDTLREAFTPSDAEVADAREVLAALDRAAAGGAGAVAAGDQMLDEALALSARRVLARAGAGR